MAPTQRTAWLLGGVALTAFLLPALLVGALVVLVLAAAAIDAWSVRRPPTVRRTVGEVLSRGVAAPLDLLVLEKQERTIVRQPASPDLRVEPSISEGGLVGNVTAIRRGRHALPKVSTRVTGPLRLGRWTHEVGGVHPVVVYPDLPAARRIAAQVRHGLFRTEGNRVRGPLGLGTEFDAIREYVDGDDVRQVNWMATSRMATPMVNQYRIEQDRDVICVVDCGRLMAAPIGNLTRLDAAVDAAAAVAAVADVVGDRVGVVAFDREIIRDLPPLRRGGEAVARAIFDLEPSVHEADYRAAFERVAGAKRAFVIVLTDLLDASAARPLVAAVPTLARKHAVAVASVSDPDVGAAVREMPQQSLTAARAVVAAEILDARAAATISIERRGVRVVDAPRERLNAASVAAYLDAKSRVRF